jgi:hypothetical protein
MIAFLMITNDCITPQLSGESRDCQDLTEFGRKRSSHSVAATFMPASLSRVALSRAERSLHAPVFSRGPWRERGRYEWNVFFD